ncbi:hypothetical protein BZA77DRAFT_354733 [Pyronema omphalodes]|nr:hypothetical protein BZA77DRAFT_354733 [Pyronema omphalodes]
MHTDNDNPMQSPRIHSVTQVFQGTQNQGALQDPRALETLAQTQNVTHAKDREGTKISVDKVPKHIEENFLFWKIFTVILAVASILYLSIHVCPKWSIEDKRTAEKMGPPLLDEFVHLQDMAKQGAVMKENYFGTRENVPRVPFSERRKIDKEAARAVRALIHAFGRGRIQSGAKFWKAYLVKIGKSTRCPIDIANKTDAKCTVELLSYINMLLGGCHIDEALEILNHQLMDRLAMYNVENPLESPSTAKIQEHIDFIKEFDTTYCRPAPPEKQKHKRIQLS